MIKTDNIVAIASPAGMGAISLIRVSGNDCINQIDNIFYAFDKIKLENQESHTLQLGYIKDGDEIIDKVLVTVFRNPKSYTGEDLVEISCHGSIYIQEKILQTILKNNCRIADPGEFTLRSFLNGKMDLSEAEAVADLIASNTKASHKLALNQMRGGFKNDINKLREELVNFASLIELELDFSQEDVEFANIDRLNDLVSIIEIQLTDLVKSFKIGNVIKNGLPIVIVGKPNSGKSTLLNCLLNEEKEILSPLVDQGVESRMELIRLEQRISDAEAQLLKTQEMEPILNDRLQRSTVKAPMDGIVNRVLVTTTGGVVQSGEPLAEIVPIEEEFLIEVEISPRDIAYVLRGQEAIVKLTAFDFAKFGSMTGTVINVGADSIQKEDGSIWYICEVAVDKSASTSLGKTVKILPGMIAQVDIISGEKTVMEYLLQPVTKIANEAFRER